MQKASKICFVLTEKTIESNIKLYNQYSEDCDLIELRADFLNEEEQSLVHTLPKQIDKPIILTFRKPQDGGLFQKDENTRIQLMRKALEGDFKYIDLEENFDDSNFENYVLEKDIRIIRSFHDFTGTPRNLESRIKNLPRNSREIPKAAVMANSTEDLLHLFKTANRLAPDERVLLAMGPFGFPSRILAARIGSCWTYTSDNHKQAAPGHIDPASLSKIYGFRKITADTEIYGIIGNPVMHTLSPLIHNRGFRLLNLPKVYLPFQVDKLKDFFELAEHLDIQGFSTTIPHKEEVKQYLTKIDEAVQKIGACNTVVKKNGQWEGSNTDAPGFLIPLKRIFQGSLKNKKATIIGAGGGAKAICFILKKEGMELFIINRTKSRAEELAREWDCQHGGMDSESLKQIKNYNDVIVQTTSMGMPPLEHLNPLESYCFSGTETLYDIIYKPPITLLLQQAKQAGCTILNGEGMLREQAYLQFKAFTGKEYPDPQGLKLFD